MDVRDDVPAGPETVREAREGLEVRQQRRTRTGDGEVGGLGGMGRSEDPVSGLEGGREEGFRGDGIGLSRALGQVYWMKASRIDLRCVCIWIKQAF